MGLFAEEAIDARPADAEPAGDRRRAELLVIEQPPDFAGIVNAPGGRCG